jgi:hypothetical protein
VTRGRRAKSTARSLSSASRTAYGSRR